MKLQLTQNESEIVSAWVNIETDSEGKFVVINSYQAGVIAHQIEETIQMQETDQGDWLRAKEWRNSKSELINKLRQLILRGD